MVTPVIITPNTDLQQTRLSAKTTINTLIEWHRSRMAEIEQGHRFYKNGEDVTSQMHLRHEREIAACQQVLHALDHMKAGDIRRAADLCTQIKEHLPNVN